MTVHGHWGDTIMCSQFHEARQHAAALISALHRFGMKVNFDSDESEAVLLLRERAAAGIKQRFVKWSKDGYVLHLGTDCHTGRGQ